MEKTTSVITFSYAKRALMSGSRERERMQSYASVLNDYHVIVFTRQSEGFPDQQVVGGLRLYATNARTKIGMLWRAYRIADRIIRSQPQTTFVVSAQDPFAASLPVLPLCLYKRVVTHVQIHGDIFNPYATRYMRWSFLQVWFARFVIGHTPRIRVVSERIKRSLVSLGVAENRITVLPIQADMEKFLQVGAKRSYSDSPTFSLLYVGRFSPEKNLSLLLGAVAAARIQDVPCHLYLRGEGPELQNLKQQVIKLNIGDVVTFQPWSNDVAAAMAAADVFCLASDHEGYAMVLQEAMAASLPIITTDVGCAGELVKHKVHGLVVPVRDCVAYAEAISTLAKSMQLRRQYGQAGYRVVCEHHDSAETYLQKIKNSFLGN